VQLAIEAYFNNIMLDGTGHLNEKFSDGGSTGGTKNQAVEVFRQGIHFKGKIKESIELGGVGEDLFGGALYPSCDI